MGMVNVFRFKYLDSATKSLVEARDYATAEAIREVGGVKLDDSGIVVDDSRVSRAGLLIRDKPAGY